MSRVEISFTDARNSVILSNRRNRYAMSGVPEVTVLIRNCVPLFNRVGDTESIGTGLTLEGRGARRYVWLAVPVSEVLGLCQG